MDHTLFMRSILVLFLTCKAILSVALEANVQLLLISQTLLAIIQLVHMHLFQQLHSSGIDVTSMVTSFEMVQCVMIHSFQLKNCCCWASNFKNLQPRCERFDAARAKTRTLT